MHSRELLKGTIEIIILKLLQENKRMYGYEMMQEADKISGGRITISEGSAPHKNRIISIEFTITCAILNRYGKFLIVGCYLVVTLSTGDKAGY